MGLVDTSCQKERCAVSLCAVLPDLFQCLVCFVCSLSITQLIVRYVVERVPTAWTSHIILTVKVGKRPGVISIIETIRCTRMDIIKQANMTDKVTELRKMLHAGWSAAMPPQ